jgi:hypothetical protein
MRIVESDQPLAAGTMQRERIAEPVRAFRRDVGTAHHEFNPVAAGLIDEQDLAIQVQERVEARIASWVPSHAKVIIR